MIPSALGAIALGCTPGRNPLCRPFSIPNLAVGRCNSNLAQYSNTPKLLHSALLVSRTTTAGRAVGLAKAGGRVRSAL